MHAREGMTSQELLDLATRLAKDFKIWSEEATLRNAVSTNDLVLLRQVAAVLERATERGVAAQVNDTPEQQQVLTGESVTTPDDTLGG